MQVIPCICSNRRRALAPADLVRTFYSAAFQLQQHGTLPSCYSLLTNPTNNTASGTANMATTSVAANEAANSRPFYFGIDCRSAAERDLGQFPKAYAFDPAGLADADEISKLLDMVETMAASAHLCLIGERTNCFLHFCLHNYFKIDPRYILEKFTS